MEDFEFIQQLKKGDPQSFRILVDRYQRFILNTCNKFVYEKETAEDLTQEVFIEVYRSVNNFKGNSKLSTWIYRIAITKSLDLLKSRKRKKRFVLLKSLFGEDEMEDRISAPDEMNPGKELENKDRLRVLTWALNQLPENQRVAFTLSKYDELSYQEIADILGTTISSVESLIYRAKQNLKKKLYHYYKKHL